MNNEELYRMMNDPSLLDGDSLVYFEQLVKEYPCFPVVCMLYLMNLAAVNDIRYGTELQKMALYLPERRKLFMFTEGEKYHLLASDKQEQEQKEDSFSLIDAYLSNHEETEGEESSSLLLEPTASTDYMHWTLSADDEKEEIAEENPLQHQELIDSFIEKGQQRLELERDAAEQPALQSEPKSLDDSFFTETLAHIYIKQRRYEKALQIIQNLNLKYPEKNVYFADQIRFLKKLIINTQKIR